MVDGVAEGVLINRSGGTVCRVLESDRFRLRPRLALGWSCRGNAMSPMIPREIPFPLPCQDRYPVRQTLN